jgi:hypothetical protein
MPTDATATIRQSSRMCRAYREIGNACPAIAMNPCLGRTFHDFVLVARKLHSLTSFLNVPTTEFDIEGQLKPIVAHHHILHRILL